MEANLTTANVSRLDRDTSLCPEYPIGLHRSAPHGGKWYYLVHEPQEMGLLESWERLITLL